MSMDVEVIHSNWICDYCTNKYDYKHTGHSCNTWYSSKVDSGCEDFEGRELIEVTNE